MDLKWPEYRDPHGPDLFKRVEEGAEGDLEVYSPESPLGRALLGAKEGETRSYELPSGASQKVTLIKAVPYNA